MSERPARRRRAGRSRRRANATLAVLALAVGVLAAVAFVALDDPESLPLDDSALPPEVPALRTPQARDPGGDASASVRLPPRNRWFGFSGSFFQWTGSDPVLDQGITAERTVIDAVSAGANSARIDVGWFSLFPEPGRISREYVAKVDAFVDALEQRGGRVLLFLYGTPPWASTQPGDRHAAPRTDRQTLAHFSRYAAFVARRWPNALAIETWNEPNGVFGWGPRPEPAAYLKLHRAAARAIRRANPDMPVLLGGMAGQLTNPQFVTTQSYMKHMYAAGLKPSDYDGLALHAYPTQGRVEPLESGFFASVFDDFRLGYAWRDPDAELWITETGVTTSGPTGFSEADQARAVVPLVRKLLTMPRVKGVYLHTQYDFLNVPESSVDRGYGLLESRAAAPGRPKPAFCALRELASDAPPFAGCPTASRR